MYRILSLMAACAAAAPIAAQTYAEDGGLIIMEAEHTPAPLDTWRLEQSIGGYTGSGSLMYDGASTGVTPPTSPLTYTFRVSTAGTYRIVLRAGRTPPPGTPGDHSNDCWMKVAGDFTAPGELNVQQLKTDQKMWAANTGDWSRWSEKIVIGHDFYDAVYGFEAGETYTITISGRAAYYHFDRVVVFDTGRMSLDQAKNVALPESGTVDGDPGDDDDDATGQDPGGSGDGFALELVDAATDSVIGPIAEGAAIDIAPYGAITVRAVPDGSVGSVRLSYSGAASGTRTESAAPYVISGDDGSGDYYPWSVGPGSYTVTATAYAEAGGSGAVVGTLARSFSLVEGGSTPPPPTPGPSGLDIPAGRLAFSHDGNTHDKDDIVAVAMNGALVWAAGLTDRVVHFDHSDHLGGNTPHQEAEMIESMDGVIARFGIDSAVVFNDQTELAAAIANFKHHAERSSAADPLWYFCAGPMEVPYRAIAAVDPAYRQFIHCVSHGTWNEVHADTPEMTHTWADMKADFPTVTYHDILDQNDSDGDNDWSTPHGKWYWLRDSSYEPYRWVYSRNPFDHKFDPSDAGMTYWFMSGGPNGGDERSGWPEAMALLEAALGDGPPVNQAPVARASASPTAGPAPLAVTFDGSASSDADGAIVAHSWSFGDGATASGATVAHSYAAAGTYVATLTVIDDDGASSSDSVSVVVGDPTPPPSGGDLPAPWQQADLGAPGFAGSASESGGAWSVTGGGADIWGTADAGTVVYRSLVGDGSITARVTGVEDSHYWAKAGVTIRGSLNADARHVTALVSAGAGVAFQRRTEVGGASLNTGGASTAAPYWVRLVRSGDVIEGWQSADGASWSLIGSTTVAFDETVLIGLSVTAHDDAATCTAGFDQVTLTGDVGSGGGLPAPWQHDDLGAPGIAGAAAEAGGSWSVTGGGADIWGTADAGTMVHQTLIGDGSITARVTGVADTHHWAKAGVMIRGSLAVDAPHAMAVVTPGSGASFQRRLQAGGSSSHTTHAGASAPRWVRLVRSGDVITASHSADGSSWTTFGSATVVMGDEVRVGLVVTAHDDGEVCEAGFDQVTVVSALAANG